MQTIDEMNAILEPETGWRVELGISPHDQSEFLRIYRKPDGDTWENKIFVGAIPRESLVGVICGFGAVAHHYYEMGKSEKNDGVRPY